HERRCLQAARRHPGASAGHRLHLGDQDRAERRALTDRDSAAASPNPTAGFVWVMVLLAPLLFVSTVAARPLYAPESLERFFHLEWDVRPGPAGPTLEGYVYNKTDMMAERMQVSIEQIDAAGNVGGPTTHSVLGRPA